MASTPTLSSVHEQQEITHLVFVFCTLKPGNSAARNTSSSGCRRRYCSHCREIHECFEKSESQESTRIGKRKGRKSEKIVTSVETQAAQQTNLSVEGVKLHTRQSHEQLVHGAKTMKGRHKMLEDRVKCPAKGINHARNCVACEKRCSESPQGVVKATRKPALKIIIPSG